MIHPVSVLIGAVFVLASVALTFTYGAVGRFAERNVATGYRWHDTYREAIDIYALLLGVVQVVTLAVFAGIVLS